MVICASEAVRELAAKLIVEALVHLQLVIASS